MDAGSENHLNMRMLCVACNFANPLFAGTRGGDMQRWRDLFDDFNTESQHRRLVHQAVVAVQSQMF